MHNISKPTFYLLCLMAALTGSLNQDVRASAGRQLSPAEDLVTDAVKARQSNIPIVLLVTSTYCEYCETIKDNVFKFLTQDERFILRELVMDNGENVRDFIGNQVPTDEVADEYQVSLTPTVLFLAPDGSQIAKPMIGVSTLDYYSVYLDARVIEAQSKLADES